MTITDSSIERHDLLNFYRENRARTEQLFSLITEDAYYERPIALRNPIVFYEGHLPAFAVNTLIKHGLGGPGVDRELEVLFARGIDPENEASAKKHPRDLWPSRQAVRAYASAADERIVDAIERAELGPRAFQALLTILEHDAMHHETLLYMWHQLPARLKNPPAAYSPRTDGGPPAHETIRIPAGPATLGSIRDSHRFGWDNEFQSQKLAVKSFEIDRYNVTNGDFMDFVDAGGYGDQRFWSPESWSWIQSAAVRHPVFWKQSESGWLWVGQFGDVPLPAAWPVFVSHNEAEAYAAWKGRRLASEAEYHRAAYGTGDGLERSQPWGTADPSSPVGNFDFQSWDPVAVGSFPAGRSAFGVDDLVGNGWEWTSSIFAPFPGFEPMASYPEYSADFFDNQHFVMKGASPVTSRRLIRRSFRNWFRPNYPYVYASFRTVMS